ncbi:hypothetical protein [Haliangium ochraceum]|uniref:hypothetical protein n=1 Tax=Haliangium ochraceum TaxID=80816 RepID=UPI00019B954E|nr:hypothetical protein [Haliangium ochraceum]
MSLVHLLLLVATTELALNRLATKELRPIGELAIPWWHLVLDHVGLFLQHFTAALAVGITARALWRLSRAPHRYATPLRWGLSATGALFLATALPALIIAPDERISMLFEAAFAGVLLCLIAAQFSSRGHLASKAGVLLFTLPLAVPVLAPLLLQVFGDGEALWNDAGERIYQTGQWTMVVAALLSPYCFAPRPVLSGAARLGPLLVAALVAALGVVILRQHYEVGMRLAFHGFGIDIGPGAPSQFLIMYLVAAATIAWTLAACLSADAPARRDIGVGIGLVVMGGYGFAWPLQYLLGVVGLLTISNAALRVRDEERGQGQRAMATAPPIAATAWDRYTRALAAALRDFADGDVSLLTVRERDGAALASTAARGSDSGTSGDAEAADGSPVPVQSSEDERDSISAGPTATHLHLQRGGRDVFVRIERQHAQGAVRCIDVLCGQEPEPGEAPVWTLYALPEKLLGIGMHPEPPATDAAIAQIDDPAFAQRFRVRDAGGWSARLLDSGLRARVAAMIDGWMALWPERCLHYRVHPGHGAPLDHPLPITELAFRGSSATPDPERMVILIALLVDIARRVGLPTADADADSDADADADEHDAEHGDSDLASDEEVN